MKNEGLSDDASAFYLAHLYPCVTLWDPYNEVSDTFISEYPVDDYEFPVMDSYYGAHPRNFYVPRVVTGRFDGGPNDMFNVMDMIFRINESDDFEIYADGIYETHDDGGSNHMAYDLAVAGDVTGNGL